MVFSIAKDIIDKELDDQRFEEFLIDFFGGEPLLKFSLINTIPCRNKKVP